MSKASSKAMEALHGALASTFKDILENGEVAIDKETGEAVKVTPQASTLNAIRQFLKDNKIEAADGANKDMNALARMHLPFQSENDEFGLPQ
jgi:hypothetical protein